MDYAYKITTHGRTVIAACMAMEKPLKITRVAFGSGRVDEDTNLADVHELLEYVSEGALAERRHENDRFYLTIQYANSEHKDVKTFLLSEFIVFVQDPESGEETDLLYGTLGDYRQPVPACNTAYPPSVFNFPLEIVLSSELTVQNSAPAGLATWDDLENSLNQHQEDPDAHPALLSRVCDVESALASALGTPGGSEIRILFESSFAGRPYTVTDGKDTHSGVVPETLSVSVKAANCDSVYTVSVTAEDGTECSRTVATGPYYGQYHVRLSAFSATIYVTAAPGADVTAECGDAAFTAAADTGGVAAVEVDAAGIYTVRAAMAGVPSSSVNVEVTASGSSYAAKVQFLVLKVKSPAGSLLSIRKKEGSEAE